MGATAGVVEYVDSNHEEHNNSDVPCKTDLGETPNSTSNNEQRRKLCNDAKQNVSSGWTK